MKKKTFKLTKLNILAIALILCVAIIAAASGSLAYFSDTREMTNVFTVGNVYISLTEAAVKDDGRGNLIEDPDAERFVGVAIDSTDDATHNYGMLFPGRTVHKDPTITNTGDDEAWIAAKIILTDGEGDINNIFGYENSEQIDIKALLSGGLLGEAAHFGTWNGIEGVRYNDRYAMVQKADARNGVYEFYFYVHASMLSGESVELFDTLFVDPEFSNADMQELVNLEITVQAFAVQTFGFADCYTAMHTAFPEHFTDAQESLYN